MIPKTFLFKLRIVEELTVEEIAAWHHSELGVKISERTVEYYLHKFGIYKPKEPKKKKKKKWKRKRTKFNQPESLHYLQKCLRILQNPFCFLDNINHEIRKNLIGKLFIRVAKKGSWTQDQGEWLRRVLRRYEVGPAIADLLFPDRYVILDWRRVDALRLERGISVYKLCKTIGISQRKYNVAFKKGTIRMSRRYAIKMRYYLAFPPTQFSKEIK